MVVSDQEEFEKIQEACLSEGVKLLLMDIIGHKDASNTIKVMPIWDEQTKNVISSTSDEMLKRLGYVSALEWVIGIIEYYQNNTYEESEN